MAARNGGSAYGDAADLVPGPTRPEDVSIRQNLPSFSSLRAFEAVFRLGSIRGAARALSLNQAVISRHLKSLEAWVGTALIERRNNRLFLTERGEAFHVKIARAIADIGAATEEARNPSLGGRAMLSCAPGLAILWLPEQIAEFERAHPDYSILVKPAESLKDFGLGEADMDIRFYGDDWPPEPGGDGLRVVELVRPRFLAVASPGFLREHPMADLAELAGKPLLNEGNDIAWQLWFKRNGVALSENPQSTRCWNAHISYETAKAGAGVALANSLLVRQYLREESLVEIFPDSAAVTLGSYSLVMRSDRWSVPVIKSCREFLKDRISRLSEL